MLGSRTYDNAALATKEMILRFHSRFRTTIWSFTAVFFLPGKGRCLPLSQEHIRNITNPEEFIESQPIEGFNILENDILVPKRRLKPREVNSARQWPSRFIPYEIDSRAGFQQNETDMLMLAFRDFAMRTCVQFVPRTNERDYVFITTDPKRGCLSYIGWQGGRQEVYLLRPNCFYLKGTIIHELMHTIGFYHEHSRPDRDDHVQVVWDNIRPDKMSNFQIEQSGNLLGAPYDYMSVMHYSALTFSKDPDDKEYTMVPKNGGFPADRLGQRRGFSPVDLQQVLTFYNCPKSFPLMGFIDDMASMPPPQLHADPEDFQPKPSLVSLVRQARNEDFGSSNTENDLQSPQFVVASSSGTVASIDVDVPVVLGTDQSLVSSVAPTPVVSSAASLCGGFFVPDAVLNFLGFFYLFKDGLYWRYAYLNGIFTKEPNFPKAYKANFNANIPDTLDSVFSYLTYIYFVKENSVWVAKSDTEIRGPVSLTKLFPGLPDVSWDNIFVRGTTINFVSRSSTWLYDIRTDQLTGPMSNYQNLLFLNGPAAELSDGKILRFPPPNPLVTERVCTYWTASVAR